MSHASHPERIGRFRILSVLGKGAQGKVYLAEDPHLQRQVAIKTLLIEEGEERDRQVRTLLDEARIVSRLQHPNIVTLYDAGEEDGTPYLVFEYVEGLPLSRLIKDSGPLHPTRAVDIALKLLAGIGYAHQKGVVHRDLKPSNVIVTEDGVPRIMDFGIARALSTEKVGDTAFFGTPLYMAPEYITERIFTPQSDLFSVGMLLYEMIAGAPAVKGGSVYETLHNIVNATFPPPSSRNAEVDERLDDVVLKALAKDPRSRFESAQTMAAALTHYLHPEPLEGDPALVDAKQSTIQFLLRRMRHKSDFPALSHTMNTINKIVASDQEGVAGLANVILRDYALTNKLLKLVNTAYYGQFGGTISTVSRAVVILGFDTIRNVAITLMLFEHLQNKAQAAQLKDEIVASLFSGIIARELMQRIGYRDAEEAFICAMFHTLGKLLVAYYFNEEMQAITRLMEQKGTEESKASAQILGVSYEELGIGIARMWHFPEKIIHSLRHVGEGKVKPPTTEEDKLRILASLSNDLCRLVRSTPPSKKNEGMKALIERYGPALGPVDRQLTAVVEDSVKELAKESGILNFDAKESVFFARVSGWAVLSDLAAPRLPVGSDQLVDGTMENAVLSTADPTGVNLASPPLDAPPDRHAVLTAGIQDITNTLVSEYQLNDVLRMILETMYRGMGFTRVLLCVRDVKLNAMVARFGFGHEIDGVLERFRFPMGYTPDVFHAAMSQGVDIYIADVNADNIRERIPEWYRRLLPAQSFILFPILVDKKPIGMFYGDHDTAGELSIQPKELSLLKTLRNQAVLAIKQKY